MTPPTKSPVGAQHCCAPVSKVSTLSRDTLLIFGNQTNPVILSAAIQDSGLAGKDLNVRTCEDS